VKRRANDDVIATDVRTRGEKIMRIINFYDPKDAQSGERQRLARKLKWLRAIQYRGTVRTGEWNAHTNR
jgi:exonuclease III